MAGSSPSTGGRSSRSKLVRRLMPWLSLAGALLAVVGLAWLVGKASRLPQNEAKRPVTTDAESRHLLEGEAERALAQRRPPPKPLSGEGLAKLTAAWRPGSGLPRLPGLDPRSRGADVSRVSGGAPPVVRTHVIEVEGRPTPSSGTTRVRPVVPATELYFPPPPVRPERR